jgi:hypothetical protein
VVGLIAIRVYVSSLLLKITCTELTVSLFQQYLIYFLRVRENKMFLVIVWCSKSIVVILKRKTVDQASDFKQIRDLAINVFNYFKQESENNESVT